MIDLENGLYIRPTQYGYDLCVAVIDKETNEIKIDPKKGERCFSPVSYHGSLASALSEALNQEQRKVLESRDYTLKEAVDEVKKIHKRLMETIAEEVGQHEKIKVK